MKKPIKHLLRGVLILAIILHWSISVVFATQSIETVVDVPLLKEIPVPKELALKVSYDQPKRMCFHQYHVRSDDWFLLNSRDLDPQTDSSANQGYIDIYDADGVFQKTIEFKSPADDGAELTENSVIIYFASYVTVVNLETDQITAYATDLYAARNAGVANELGKKTQSSNHWKYTSKGNLFERHTLIRSNKDCKEVLISFRGVGLSIGEWFFAVGSAVIILAITIYGKKKGRKSPNLGNNK